MYVILGSSGHVGSAVASHLLSRGQAITMVSRDAEKMSAWRQRGATLAEVDVRDADALRAVFRTATRAFLLNPPADPAVDTDAEERHTVAAILAALEGSGLQKVVAESTYAAQPGARLGDLNTLFGLEEGLRARAIPALILRAAYYFTNWDGLLAPVLQTGALPTLFPADLCIPMVSPQDLGRHAAEWLAGPVDDVGVRYVEGPQRYTVTDVAAAFSDALGREVTVDVAPREMWEPSFRKQGFSEAAAHSYARMTAVVVDGLYELPQAPVRGEMPLHEHIARLVAREAVPHG